MAIITNYATLKTAVTDYLARSNLNTFVPNFIQNAENKIYRSVLTRDMEEVFTDTIANGTITLPLRYVELKYAYVNLSPTQWLSRVPPETIYDKYPNRSGGETPCLIAQEGDAFIFGPYPNDVEIKGVYYRRYQKLADETTTTNWYTDNAPEVLLYAALLESAPFIGDDPRLQVWGSLLSEAIGTIENEFRREKNSGPSKRVRVA